MEIPIQVAVRIYPYSKCTNDAENDEETRAAATTTNATTTTLKDANGNETASFETLLHNGGTEPDQIRYSLTDNDRYCVQAIPIATSRTFGYMGGQPLPSALPGSGQLDSIAAGLIQVGPHSYPVTHALSAECTQIQVYQQTVYPLISLFMEGFDASVVTYGEKHTGKSYTLYGPDNADICHIEDPEVGVVQRSINEIFAYIENHTDRTYIINIGFVEICGDGIRDLLGIGNLRCTNATEVFHFLQIGLSAREKCMSAHTLFTLTLEQQWITKEGLIQHRLSTASFSDLCATERQFVLNAQERPASVPSDSGLHMLEKVVHTLTDPTLMYGLNGNIPYGQTTLTTLLKDSFGGRAQTLVILCVSPLDASLNETMCNLQFAFKVQCIRNYVVMNTFSDDNTPISPEAAIKEDANTGNLISLNTATETFGLQFAVSQWFKLVSNAEGLFSKLVSSEAITPAEKEQIEEWLFLKQECEECLSSSEIIHSRKPLRTIEEDDEPDESGSDPETSCQQNSDNESETESHGAELAEKLEILMDEFCAKTDELVQSQHEEFISKLPKAVMESQESFKPKQMDKHLPEKEKRSLSLPRAAEVEKIDDRKLSVGGRRRSIQPGASLSSAEIAMLNRVASRDQHVSENEQEQEQAEEQVEVNAMKLHTVNEYLDSSSGDGLQCAQIRAAAHAPVEHAQKKLRKLDADIEAYQRQIKEIEDTMQIKQNIITELVKNNETRSRVKHRFNKKKSKLEGEYEKTKKQMTKALVQGKDPAEIERLRAILAHTEQRLEDLNSMKHIASESAQKIKKLQQSLQESKKQAEDLHKKAKKGRKLRYQLEVELKALKVARDAAGGSGGGKELIKADQLKEVQARISHLDHILREKSNNLEQCDDGLSLEHNEPLRHEIRNLRRTRDHLLEQRCTLDRKLKRDKTLSQREERKLLECDEAIEAIDAAIEFKNELICGHKSIDTSGRLHREKGEQMLMARLNKLTLEEMRTLLYKYFTKVIDLRDSSRKLEVQLVQLEREREAWEWKERVLSNAVRQARLEGERNAVLLQRQHETKLTLMLRHLAEETSTSSTSFSDLERNFLTLSGQPRHNPYYGTPAVALSGNSTSTPTTTTTTDFDYEMDYYRSRKYGLQTKSHPGELEMCPLNGADALTKYKPLDKYKDKERTGTKNNILAKIQVFTRYAAAAATHSHPTNGGGAAGGASAAGNADEACTSFIANGAESSKKQNKDEQAVAIPEANLRHLMAAPLATKVTRQKNKIIIQDATRKN